MKAVIFGATGMVGSGVLRECLEHPDVESVLVVGRSSCDVENAKMHEVIHQDFFDYSGIEESLRGFDACFFCLGVSSFRMSEERYHRLTYELTLKAAETLARLNPDMTFCYVSGTGTDSSESGRIMWARVKGKTENQLLRLPFKAVYLFRPGYIQPLKGIRSKTSMYQAMYNVLGPLYPVWNKLFPNYVTTTEKLGLAMIHVAMDGYPRTVLENRDINSATGRQ
jgi:uncharacterized protein YbjT (DUF2867 family)